MLQEEVCISFFLQTFVRRRKGLCSVNCSANLNLETKDHYIVHNDPLTSEVNRRHLKCSFRN